MEPVKVILAGIGGYGESYVDALLNHAEGRGVELIAAADPCPERCTQLDVLKQEGVRLYPSLSDALEKESADLVINATPIHLHRPLTCEALSKGCHVLCEKPLAATIQEAYEMLEATHRAERLTAIGYQWSFSDAVQALKADILAGTFGRPIRLRAYVSWPRTEAYYRRSNWAGSLKTRNGDWVLDSPLNNATAHYLNNMLYVLGNTPETAATPVELQAELYRANPIENFDTAMLRCRTEENVEVLFYTSHAVPTVIGPLFSYEFEEAIIEFQSGGPDQPGGNHFGARLRNGQIRDYGNPNNTTCNKIWQTADCIRNGGKSLCGIEAAIPHTLCVNGAQESAGEVTSFPSERIHCDTKAANDHLTWVDGLQEVMRAGYDRGLLPSELGDCGWARAGCKIQLTGYHHFPSAESSSGDV